MSKKRYSPEEVVNKLREADVLIAKGQTVAKVCKQLGVTSVTYYRWRKEYGGMKADQARRLKELERENARLKCLQADAGLEKAILRAAAPKTAQPAAEASGAPAGGGTTGFVRAAGVPGSGPIASDAAVSANRPGRQEAADEEDY